MTRHRLACLLAIAVGLAAAGAAAQTLRFGPIDEGVKDAVWVAYKTRLLDALEARNRPVLIAAIDPNIDNGLDQKPGLDEFRRRWDFDDDKSPMWDELRKAIVLGGAFLKNEKGEVRFCAPYVSARWPTTHDPFRYGAIVAADTLVKHEPSANARTLGTLDHGLVPVEDWEVADATPGFPQKWTRIRLRDAIGYVPEQQIRSPIEHMACFAAAAGNWRMISFTAGVLPE